MQDAQRSLLTVVLRQFHAALKTFGLYSAKHAAVQSLRPGFGTTLQGYLQMVGPLSIQVGWDRLRIGGETLQDGGAASLAHYLSVRNVAFITILPGVSDQELEVMLSGLSHDREMLEALGGIEHVLSRADLAHVSVTGGTLRRGDQGSTELDAQTGLLNGDRLSADQRDLVLDILRSGPDATARLLTTLYELAKHTDEDRALPSLVQALEALDRTILDEPLEDQEPLVATLARAHPLLDEPLRSDLTRELIGHATKGGAARTIITELTGEEIPQINDVLRQLNVFPGELSNIVASLQPVSEARSFTAEAPPPLHAPVGESISDEWAEIPPEMVELLPGEERALSDDIERLTEPFITVDTVMTLTNVLYLEDDTEQLLETANIVAGYLPALAAAGRVELVASTLDVLREVANRTGEHRASVEAAIARVRDALKLDPA